MKNWQKGNEQLAIGNMQQAIGNMQTANEIAKDLKQNLEKIIHKTIPVHSQWAEMYGDGIYLWMCKHGVRISCRVVKTPIVMNFDHNIISAA